MKRTLLSLLISATLCLPALAEEDPAAPYRAAIKEFGGGLKSTLQEGMKAGGPLAAVAICNTKAQPIAQEYAEKYGWDIRRTSLKIRNPDNAPTDYEKAVLEKWAGEFRKGDDASKLESLETVEIDGKSKQVFMKGIGTAKVCTTCHGGEGLDPELEGKLAALYPEDQARDYSEGDLRGAFVIVADTPEE
jgi:hypothetical protein